MSEYRALFEPNLQFKYPSSKILVNGKLFVFNSSTDTLAEIFSDDTATVPLSQPVRTDSNGRGPIYVADGRYYRLEVYDANGKLLWTQTGLPTLFVNEGVIHDETLLGEGIINDPLKVNTDVIATDAELADLRQDMDAGDAYLQFQIDNIRAETDVIHDDTLSGNGTSANPLGVIGDITPYSAGHNITITNHTINSVDEIMNVIIGNTSTLYWADVYEALFNGKPVLHAHEEIFDTVENKWKFIQGFEAKLITSSTGSSVSNGNYALFTRIDPDSKKLIVWKCEPATPGSMTTKCRWTKTEEEIGGAGQFIADYNVTTFDEIKEAYDAGKLIIARRSQSTDDYRYYWLSEFLHHETYPQNDSFRFSDIDYFGFHQGLTCFRNNWQLGDDKQVLFTDTGVMNDELNYNDEHTAITGISGTPIRSTGGLVAVEHDGTLTGDGSSGSPMGISNDFTIPYSAHEDYGGRQEDRYTQLIYTPNQALVTTYSSVATQDDRPGETFTTYESNAITPGGVRSELWSTDKNGDIKTNETQLVAEIGPNDIYWSMSALDGTEETASLRQVASAMNAYSANWNSTYSTVQSNSAAWGQDTGITAVEHDKTLTGKGISSDKAGVNEIWVPVKDDDGAITLTARSDAPYTGNYIQITPNWSGNENEAHVRVFSEYGDNKWHWQEMDGAGSGLFQMQWGSGSNTDSSAATAHLSITNGDIAYSIGSGAPADQTYVWSVSAMARDLNMKVPASYVSPDYEFAVLGTRSFKKEGDNGSYIEFYEYNGRPQLAVNENNRITQIMSDGMRIYDGDWNLLHEFNQYDMKLSGKSFNSIYDTVSSNSASWGQGGALPQSANWNNCYTTVNTYSANWENTRTTLNSNSGTWNNKQAALSTAQLSAISSVSGHINNSNIHVTSTDKSNWNAKATTTDISNAINALDVSDAAVANQFVTKVSETNGKISVSRAQPTITDVSGLQTALNGKQATISDLSTIRTSAANGQTAYSWGNHAGAGYLKSTDITGKEDKANIVTAWNSTTSDTKYPSEKLVKTALDNKVDKETGKGLSTNDYTTTEKNKLGGIAAGAEVNQNAFSNIVVGSTTIAADAKTDTLTVAAGTNILLTPDATNDKITISAKDTTYSVATTAANGLLSKADKIKLNDIPSGVQHTVFVSTADTASAYVIAKSAYDAGYNVITRSGINTYYLLGVNGGDYAGGGTFFNQSDNSANMLYLDGFNASTGPYCVWRTSSYPLACTTGSYTASSGMKVYSAVSANNANNLGMKAASKYPNRDDITIINYNTSAAAVTASGDKYFRLTTYGFSVPAGKIIDVTFGIKHTIGNTNYNGPNTHLYLSTDNKASTASITNKCETNLNFTYPATAIDGPLTTTVFPRLVYKNSTTTDQTLYLYERNISASYVINSAIAIFLNAHGFVM